MDPLKTIGTFLKDLPPRDAVHIAVLAVTAGENLAPGDWVKFAYGRNDLVLQTDNRDEAIGIIDPYLRDWAAKDTNVWCFMMPGSIVGIRHEWAHPGVDVVHGPVSTPELWLRQFAERWHFDYGALIEAATAPPDGNAWGNYVVAQGIDLHSRDELGEDHDLFWKHLEKLTGRTFDQAHQDQMGWSCSC